MTDLWPNDLANANLKAPVTILREQAALLGQKTHNIVTAEVRTVQTRPDADPFRYAFYLVAPALDGYQFKLFSISNGIALYPVKIRVEGDKEELAANDEASFVDVLGDVLQSERTKQVVGAMLVQSEGAVPA